MNLVTPQTDATPEELAVEPSAPQALGMLPGFDRFGDMVAFGEREYICYTPHNILLKKTSFPYRRSS